MARPIDIKVTLDLPDGVEFLGTERVGDGHGIEVKFPLPDVCQCDACGHEEAATYECKKTVYMARHLDRCGQPCSLVFQPCFHRCSRRDHRREHLAPFERKHVTYTYDFEEYVVRRLIGGNEEDVARQLGIWAGWRVYRYDNWSAGCKRPNRGFIGANGSILACLAFCKQRDVGL